MPQSIVNMKPDRSITNAILEMIKVKNVPYIIKKLHFFLLTSLAYSHLFIGAVAILTPKTDGDSFDKAIKSNALPSAVDSDGIDSSKQDYLMIFIQASLSLLLIYVFHKLISANMINGRTAAVNPSEGISTITLSNTTVFRQATQVTEPNSLEIQNQSTVHNDIYRTNSKNSLYFLAVNYTRDRVKEQYGVNHRSINNYDTYLRDIKYELEKIKKEFSKFNEGDIEEMQSLVIHLHRKLIDTQSYSNSQDYFRANF